MPAAEAAKHVLHIPLSTCDISHRSWPSFTYFNYLLLAYLDLAYFTPCLHWPCLFVYILFYFYSISQSYFTRAVRHSAWVVADIFVYLNKSVPCQLVPAIYSPNDNPLINPLADPLAATRPAHPARYLYLPYLFANRHLDDLIRYTHPRYLIK